VTEAEAIEAPLEALLLVATEPVAATDLAAILGQPVSLVDKGLTALAEFYDRTGRGFELRQVGQGWRYYTREAYADVIAHAVVEGQPPKLSQAALETLAVIAYLQPISRGKIAAVRGVNVDSVVRTLLTRELISETERDETSGAGLLGTTPYFLERMGLSSLDELPALAPNLPDAADLDAELRRVAADAELLAATVDGPDETAADTAGETTGETTDG